jgi:hypothetical protein
MLLASNFCISVDTLHADKTSWGLTIYNIVVNRLLYSCTKAGIVYVNALNNLIDRHHTLLSVPAYPFLNEKMLNTSHPFPF